MLSRFVWAYSACVSTCVLLAGCSLFDGEDLKPELACDPKDPMCICDPAKNPACPSDAGLPSVGAIGKECSGDEQCMNTLRLGCIEGACALIGDLAEGSTCSVTGECEDGLYCAIETDRTCTKAGDAGEGARCAGTGECQRGLVCAYSGLTQKCIPSGDGDL